MAPRAPLAAGLAALLLGGCVTSRVLTDDPDAVIWFDGRPVGRSGRIWSVGPPHTARVLVVAKDGRRARATVDREFTWVTLEAGLRTLGVCLVLCWTYPQDIVVPLPPRRPDVGWDVDPGFDPWGDGADGSAWTLPPRTNASADGTANAKSNADGNASADADANVNANLSPSSLRLPPSPRGTTP